MLASKWRVSVLLAVIGTTAAFSADRAVTTQPALEVGPPAYRVGPGDVLQIEVWREPEASNNAVTVRPDGRITLSFIGEVSAAGQTPAELESILSGKFEDIIRFPRVTVTVREANSQRVFLIGEVRREGVIRLLGPITVLQALAEAGGITDYAKRKNIYILRTVDGRQYSFPFDYDAVVRGQKVTQNVILLSGDTIVVPR